MSSQDFRPSSRKVTHAQNPHDAKNGKIITQPRPQGLLAFQNGGGSGEDPGAQQITCLQRGWRCIQNGGYGEKGEKNWVRDAKVKINKLAEKAEVQFKKK